MGLPWYRDPLVIQHLSKVTGPANTQPPTSTTNQAEQFVSSLVEFEKNPMLFERLYAVLVQ